MPIMWHKGCLDHPIFGLPMCVAHLYPIGNNCLCFVLQHQPSMMLSCLMWTAKTSRWG